MFVIHMSATEIIILIAFIIWVIVYVIPTVVVALRAHKMEERLKDKEEEWMDIYENAQMNVNSKIINNGINEDKNHEARKL